MDCPDDTPMPMELPVFAKNLRKARVARGMSQAEVSRLTGVDKSYISDVERCLANPTLAMMSRLASAVRVPMAELLADGTTATP